VIAKASPSAFSNPELEQYFRSHDVQYIYMVGVFAEGCVRSTVIDLVDLALSSCIAFQLVSVLGVVALFTHLGFAAYWHAQSSPRVARVLMIDLPSAVGVVVSLLIVMSLAGVLFSLEVPTQYKATYVLPNR